METFDTRTRAELRRPATAVDIQFATIFTAIRSGSDIHQQGVEIFPADLLLLALVGRTLRRRRCLATVRAESVDTGRRLPQTTPPQGMQPTQTRSQDVQPP